MSEEKRDFRQVVWCWVKKFPCKAECQLYDFETHECKIVLVCNKLLQGQ